MKKKIFLLFITVFLLSGCTASYSVNINEDNSVSEEASITELKSAYYGAYDEEKDPEYAQNVFINELITKKSKEYNITGYKRNDSDTNHIVSKENSYSSISDLKKSSILNTSFKNVDISNNGDIWTINLNNFDYGIVEDGIQNISINIHLPYYVIESNSNEKSELTNYSWNFDVSNARNLSVKLVFDTSKSYDYVMKNEDIKTNEDKKNWTTIAIVIVCVLAFGGVIFIVFKTMYGVNNEV